MIKLSTTQLLRATFFVFMLAGPLVPRAFSQAYNFSASTGTFTPVSGGTAIDAIEEDENLSNNLPIGFTFKYFGTDYTQFVASSNGFISFNTTTLFSSGSTNAIATFEDEVIAPLWDDLDGSDGTASYSLSGTAGNRVLTVEWLNYEWSYTASSPNISFQVKLYETTNKIEFVYRREGGTLASPSASIGLATTTFGKFYSLADVSASPSLDVNGNDKIASAPASNQVYTFTPTTLPGAPAAPTVQASAVAVTSNTDGAKLGLTWTNGNGAYRSVFVKQTTSTSELPALTNGNFYLANATYGSSLASAGWYCVYNGTGNSVTVSGLKSGFTYRVAVVEYNGSQGQQTYNIAAGTGNPANANVLLVEPGTPFSTVRALRVSGSELTFDLDRNAGTKSVVFIKAGTTGKAPVVNSTTYTANLEYGSGTQIGSSGWYCVYNDVNGGRFTITALQGNTNYIMHVIDYNGPAGSEKYNSASNTPGPVSFTTLQKIPAMTYTFAASAGTFTPLSAGTEVTALEDDDFSATVPIGFTFRLSGVPYTEMNANSNGYVSFNPFSFLSGDVSTYSNNLDASITRPLIAALWDDLDGRDGGKASYQTSGSAPNRVFTLEYLNWKWLDDASATISFQIKLYETSNKIEFAYRQEAGAPVIDGASIGLAFANTGSGNFISLNDASASPTFSTTVETDGIGARPATGQIYSFTPQKLNQTITFPTVPDKVYGNAPFALSATSTSGLPVTYASSNTNIATISGNIVTLVGIGSVTITASQAGDDNYNAAPDAQRSFIVNKGDQIIQFTLVPTPYGTTIDLHNYTTPLASGLPITFTSSNTSVATISGYTLTVVGVGTADITASQPGNDNYNAATNVVKTLTATKGNQIITTSFSSDKRVGDSFALNATVNTGLPLTYASSNEANATVSATGTVTALAAGPVTITISQAGNDLYAANSLPLNFNFSKGVQQLTFDEIADKTMGDASFTIHATASSGLPVYFTVSGNDHSEISLDGTQVTILAPGSVTITAHQDGDANYMGVGTVSRTFCIMPAKPTITVTGLDTEATVIHGPAGFSGNYVWLQDGHYPNYGSDSRSADFSPKEAGVYTLELVVDFCTSEPSNAIALIVTDVEQSADVQVQVFPNPVEQELIIDVTRLNAHGPVSISLRDGSGKIVHASSVQGKTTIPVKGYPAGIYFLEAGSGAQRVVKKIVKK